MLRKQWQEYALKAKQIAKHIVTGLEQDKNGVRLIQIVYGLDMYATDALNLKYSKQRSKSSVHTYQGGIQEISTQHADGSEGLFKSNGECQSTNNPMDIEVKEYMNNSKNESKNMNKKLIRLTESDLHRIVKESVNRVLKENNRRTKRMIREFDDYDEYDVFEDEEYVDKKGHPIRIGSQVIWYDPEKSARDLKRVWTVDDMRGDIVYISDEFSEAEVYPQELVVVG